MSVSSWESLWLVIDSFMFEGVGKNSVMDYSCDDVEGEGLMVGQSIISIAGIVGSGWMLIYWLSVVVSFDVTNYCETSFW